ncbi:hypothetical protein GCK72_003128 [Caenorhabditis remanei]|uniref:F-box domain-containing protein n=1 Tax=Caenorhabditis remanei TaxID=31234 RepID=A0A6A5HYH8_CAERE|nr:hypothetical protein GCK72_003128 [Caenorhabditis remanei]KAF1771302.1 hypothetical protein GCK72_003128 [Caenorhabditis remanei]
MSSSFPLLRLPRLVLFEVFKSLSIGEKIKLSFCSKKISTQIYNCRLYSQKVIVDLDIFHQKIEVSSENNKEPFEISIRQDPRKTINSKTQHIFIACYTNGITIFWENHRDGYLSVIRHISKMFQCKFSISNNIHSDLYQPVVSELYDLQQEFKKFTIDLNISSKFGLVEDLIISSIRNPGFKPVFTSWPQNINIMGSDWFTLKSILACTCITITLENSSLEIKDMNEILKNWKAGGFPNLKRLAINSLRFKNNGEQILGINWMELNRKVIQSDDGSKKATINTYRGHIEMSVTPF